MESLVMPVGLLLIIDHDNGGDASASEAIRRFNYLDFESRDFVDFYFLGWKRTVKASPHSITFSLDGFSACKRALERAGVRQFGGYADLILLDAVYNGHAITLNFAEAMHIDLAAAVKGMQIESIGRLLQSIIEGIAMLKNDQDFAKRPTFYLSDYLSLAIAKDSMLDAILTKLAHYIGGKKLKAVVTRDIGPVIGLSEL